MTSVAKNAFKRMPCIDFLVQFQENTDQVRNLLYSGNKINVISPAYTWKLGFKIRKTNLRAQKINGYILKIFRTIIANLKIEDNVGKLTFFKKTLPVANIKFEMVLRISFLKISNTACHLGKNYLCKSFILSMRLY